MKRYLLFSYTQYYPSGGWSDFVGDFDTAAQAASFWNNKFLDDKSDDGIPDEYAHLIDTQRPANDAYVAFWSDYEGWRLLWERADGTRAWRYEITGEIDRELTNRMAGKDGSD